MIEGYEISCESPEATEMGRGNILDRKIKRCLCLAVLGSHHQGQTHPWKDYPNET